MNAEDGRSATRRRLAVQRISELPLKERGLTPLPRGIPRSQDIPLRWPAGARGQSLLARTGWPACAAHLPDGQGRAGTGWLQEGPRRRDGPEAHLRRPRGHGSLWGFFLGERGRGQSESASLGRSNDARRADLKPGFPAAKGQLDPDGWPAGVIGPCHPSVAP